MILNYWLYSTKSSIFGTNDDELISSLVNGHLTESSEIRLIFIQPIIGIFSKFIRGSALSAVIAKGRIVTSRQ